MWVVFGSLGFTEQIWPLILAGARASAIVATACLSLIKKKKKAANVHCWMTKEMGRKIKESFYNGDGDRGHPKPWCEIQRRRGAHGCRAISTLLFSPLPKKHSCVFFFSSPSIGEENISLLMSFSYWGDRLRNTDYSFSWRRKKKKNPDSHLFPGSYVWIWVVNVSVCGYRYF